MTNRNTWLRLGVVCVAWACAIGGLGLVAAQAGAQTQPDKKDQPTPAPKVDDKATPDTVIFRNGNIVQGTILEETETTVKMRVVVAGMTAVTSYNKADILDIRHGAKTDQPKKDEPKKDEPKKDTKPDTKAADSGSAKTKVYVINMTGEFGRDISKTPMKKVVEDVKKFQPEVLIYKIDCTYSYYGMHVRDFEAMPGFYDQLFTAAELMVMMTDQIRDDPEWKVKPRLVCWVKKAMGGAAFMPFPAKEIYFTTGGQHGGIGLLDRMFGNTGDDVVREKQRSLRMKAAEGLALKGDHDERIIKAMSRGDYELSYRLDGGKAVFYEGPPRTPDEIQLKAKLGSESHDTVQDLIRAKSKYVLVINDVDALRIGLSNGTADTLDQLMSKMGIIRDWELCKGKGDDILKEWGQAVTKAEKEFETLFGELEKVQVKPPAGYQERTAARGQRKAILQKIFQLLEKYKEAINPRTIQGAPDDWEKQIQIWIDQIEQQQRLDKRDK